MDPTNDLFLEVWEIFDDIIVGSKKKEAAEKLLKVFEEYGADPDILRELGDNEPVLLAAIKNIFGEEEIHKFDEEDF